MRPKKSWFIVGVTLAVIAVTLVLAAGAWAASTFKVLHRFTGDEGPIAGLIFDAAGNLYGTTPGGGSAQNGTVFRLMPNPDGSWTESVLYSFCSVTNCADGANPEAGLIFDAAGNLYGTTQLGGSSGAGTAFKLTPNPDGSWTESVLHSFTSFTFGTDGAIPLAGLIFDAAGNLYGTTSFGGNVSCNRGCGTVFKLTPNPDGSWTESVLHSFCFGRNCAGADGAFPAAGVIFDAAGNLYGTTVGGGGPARNGTVFKLTPNPDGTWTERVIHSFCPGTNCADGHAPLAGLIFDRAGKLFGTTAGGGALGFGVVFNLTPNSDGTWTERVIHSFANHPAATPFAGLILDAAGNLYGTTSKGGPVDGGTVFKMTPNLDGSWAFSALHVFQGKPAENPHDTLVLDKVGNLYGTTMVCGTGTSCQGVVFKLTP